MGHCLVGSPNLPLHLRVSSKIAANIDQSSLIVILISTAWSDANGDEAVEKMTENTISRIGEAAESLGVANRYLYINYASERQADEIFAGYGEENVQRLKQIQRAVDPRGVYTSKGLWRGFVKLL